MTAASPRFRACVALVSWIGGWLSPGCPAHALPALPDPQEELAPESTGSRHAFIEVRAEPTELFVHETLRLRLRFGVEREFLEERMIQPFRRPLDVPVQVQAAWLDELVGTIPLEDATQPLGSVTAGLTFALEGEVHESSPVADELIDGRTFLVVEIERSFRVLDAGPLLVPAPRLRFAYATSFREDLLHGRVPADRRDAFAVGAPLSLEVRPLPETDRPSDFGGAIGPITLKARVDRTELAVGESLALTLLFTGEGDLARFDPPRLDRLSGFHLYGTHDDAGPSERSVTYDLAPRSDQVRAVPPISFTWFDPQAGTYRTEATAAIPIRVLPPSDQAPDASVTEGSRGEQDGPSPLLLVASGLGLLLLAGLVAVRRRRPTDPRHAQARRAATALRESGGGDHEALDTLVGYLAARSGCPAPSLVGPDLGERLVEAGIPHELAARAVELVDRLERARWGDGETHGHDREVRDLVEALELSS